MLIPIDGVELLGPIVAQKWEHEHEGDVDAEEWSVGDLRFLEISVVAKAGTDPKKAQAELRQRALDGDLKFEEGGGPKTTLVLQHLARKAD